MPAGFEEFGNNFQEKVIQALLTDHKWAEQMIEVLSIDYFDQKHLQYLAQRYFAYYEKYRSFPTLKLLVDIMKDELKTGSDAVLRDRIIDYIKKIYMNPDAGDLQYVKDKSLDFCRKQAMKKALENSVDLIAADDYERVVTTMKEALAAGMPSSVGHIFFEDYESRFAKIERRTIPTGIEQLDDRLILDGGFGRGELIVCMAPTGVGKSHFLVQIGANALRAGKNVVHYTFELTESATGIRYDANLTGIAANDVRDNKDVVLQKYNEMDLGRLIIKEYPTGSASVMTLRNHIEKLTLKNFKPHIIIIDYADIMRSTRKFDSMRHELKLIYEELRNVAMEMGVPIVTASQANRDASNSEIVGLENMSEAYGKAMVADFVLSLSRKPEEKASGLGRMYIAKNRMGKDGIVFPIRIDTARSIIQVSSELETLDQAKKNEETELKDKLAQRWKELKQEKDIKLKKLTNDKK